PPQSHGGGLNSSDLYSSLTEKHLNHAEVLVVIIAEILGHPFARDDYFRDPALHDGARAVHAWHNLHVNRTGLRGRAGAGRVADRVPFGVLDPKILGRAEQSFRHVVADPAREGVVAGGADFVVGTDDDAADLRVGVLTAGR